MSSFKIASYHVWQNLWADIAASLVVFALGLPLSLGIAMHTGAPMVAGLLATSTGALVGSAIIGVPMQVIGPVVALAPVAHGLLVAHGAVGLALACCLAGGLMLLFGALRLGSLVLKVPENVLHGVMAGVGLSVVLSQLPLLRSNLDNAVVGLVAIVLQLGLDAWRYPLKAVLPSSLLMLLLISGLIHFWQPAVQYVTLPNQFSALFDQNIWQLAPNTPVVVLWRLLPAALTIALVASIQTLLAARALSSKTPQFGPMNPSLELLRVGMANMVSGCCGGLPVSGVVLRGQANWQAGARSRWSAWLSGAWVLLALFCCAAWLQKIPLASLSALFVVIGLRMTQLAHLPRMWREGTVWVHWLTALVGHGMGLLWGVGTGCLLHWLLTTYGGSKGLTGRSHAKSTTARAV